MIKGIDVSVFQGEIDWPKVKADGVEFAIIRATYGKNDVDINFAYNVKEAKATGIAVGAYHYCYAKSVDEAREEAQHFLSVIKGYQFEYPVCLDFEDSSLSGIDKETLTNIAIAFLETIENAGYFVAIYANLDWFNNKLNDSRLKPYAHWLAQWGDKPTYAGLIGLWQHADNGQVSGINGNVDMDYSYNDYAQTIKLAGLNGFVKAAAQDHISIPKLDAPDEKINTSTPYTVQPGDTLCSIAQRFKGSAMDYKELAQINNIKDPNVIHVGEKIYLYKPDPVAPPVEKHTYYTVQPGDTLCGIAQKLLGSSMKYKELASKNHITDPNVIKVGQKLLIK